MKPTDKIYCLPGDRFPANFILAKFADANAEMPVDAPKSIVIIPDPKGILPDKFHNAIEDLTPRQAYLLSSAEIYGENYNEATEDAPAGTTPEAEAWKNAEEQFISYCRSHNTIPTILRLPLLIGTGMTGEMRRRLNAIHRGVYRHIENNDAHQSVLHARDLPELIAQLHGIEGVFNVSDHTDPSPLETAEALSARLGAKRIYTVKPRWATIAARLADILGLKDLGSSYLRSLTATRTISTSRIASVCPDWLPTDTINFLRTHNYSHIDT